MLPSTCVTPTTLAAPSTCAPLAPPVPRLEGPSEKRRRLEQAAKAEEEEAEDADAEEEEPHAKEVAEVLAESYVQSRVAAKYLAQQAARNVGTLTQFSAE